MYGHSTYVPVFVIHVTQHTLLPHRSHSRRHGRQLHEYHEGREWPQCFGLHQRRYSKSSEGNFAAGEFGIRLRRHLNIQFCIPVGSLKTDLMNSLHSMNVENK